MKRLFMLRTKKRGSPIRLDKDVVYFESKVEAKAERDRVVEKEMFPTAVVSYGPDHRLFKGE